MAPRPLPSETKMLRGLRGVRSGGCCPHEVAVESALGDAGVQGRAWSQEPCCDLGQLISACPLHRCQKLQKCPIWLCEPLSCGCQWASTVPRHHPGLTCLSPLLRRLAVTAGWPPGRCEMCARCVAGTTARAVRRTALSRPEEPEVGASLGVKGRAPPSLQETPQPRAWVPAASVAGPARWLSPGPS